MNARRAWRYLGIAPTHDARLVRKAYADKLRDDAIANDPDAFAQLRNARDVALANLLQEAEVETDNFGLGNVAPTNDSEADANSTVGTRVRSQLIDGTTNGTVSEHSAPDDGELPNEDTVLSSFAFDPPVESVDSQSTVDPNPVHPSEALYGLLLENDIDAPLNAQEIWEAENLIEAIARDADVETVEASAQIEEWVAELLARSIPRSDPLIRFAGQQFRWEARIDDRDLSPALAFVVARQKTINFLTAVGDKKHRLHGAWRVLEAHQGLALSNAFVRKKDVGELLDTVRRDHPGLEEAYFNPERVQRWDESLTERAKTKRGVFAWIFLVIVLLNAYRCAPQQPGDVSIVPLATPPRTVIVGLTDEKTNIDAALMAVTGGRLNSDALKKANPELYGVLRERWKDAAEVRQDLSTYVSTESSFLNELINRSVPRLPYDLIAQYRQLEVLRLSEARIAGEQSCDDALRGRYKTSEGYTLENRAAAIKYGTLIVIDGKSQPRPKRWTYTIPASIVEKTSKSLGIPPEQFGQAMRGKLDSIDRCAARIALIRTVLSVPAEQGIRLLREM